MSKKESTVELAQPLLTQENNEYHYTIDQLAYLFNQDNVKDIADGANVSLSIHKLEKEMEGVNTIAHHLKSNLVEGIEGSPADLERRRQIFGDNRRIPRKIKTLWELFTENFEDFILKVLIGAAFVSLILGIINDGWEKGWIEGVSIFVAIAIILIVNTGQNYNKEKQFQELANKQDVCSARVTRDGKLQTIDAEELVVGDIIAIPAGDTIPADVLAFKTITFSTNESSLTGEPEPKSKEAVTPENYESNPNPFLLQSTLAETGNASAIVLVVGKNTCSGRAERCLEQPEPTPLQKKLETIADLIGKMGFTVALLTFTALIVKLLCQILIYKTAAWDKDSLSELLNAFIIAVTIIVVAVPEGLPLAVTISLAYSVLKMNDLGNLVRRLNASETMGGANEICTDKTGTLTQNNMTVQAFYVNDKVHEGHKFEGLFDLPNGELIAQAVLYNSSAFIGEKDGKKITMGNVTECGIINYLNDNGVPCEELIKHRKSENFELCSIPFSSARKRETNVVTLPNGKIRVFVKGAPEIVLGFCDHYCGVGGSTHELSGSKKKEIINDVIGSFANKCFRTIIISYVDLDHHQFENLKSQANNFKDASDKEVVESGLTMIGIFGIMDPLRPGIAGAVDQCHAAGVNVRMCTGDNIDTATAISLEAHILSQDDLADTEDRHLVCMIGKDFQEYIGGLTDVLQSDGTKKQKISNMKAFRKIQQKLKVLARSQPEHKYMLVTGLKELNCVVAVTGDGNNDVPALNKADVGFSMGIAGTDVCRNASSIVLTNDDFCSVIVAILYGRNIYDNVRKFLQFQLTVNCAAMFIVFVGALLLADEALTPVQMLWVNLIMDTLAALALATEPPHDELLRRKPHDRNEKIINSTMWRNIIGHAIYQIAVLLTVLFYGVQIFKLQDYDENEPFFVTKVWAEDFMADTSNTYETDPVCWTLATNAIASQVFDTATAKCRVFTMVFQMFVMMTIFNIINARKLGEKEYNVFSNFFNNSKFIFIFLFIVGMQIWLCQSGGMIMRTSGLNMNQHLACIGVGAFGLIWGVLIKALMPARWFDSLSINEEEMEEEHAEHTFTASLRKSFRESLKAKGAKIDAIN